MDKLQCMRCSISGKVQGVWYRASTKVEADQLGLTGWARNMPDGRVEVFACGTKENLQILYEWLQQGPPLAKVAQVTYDEEPWEELKRFETY